MAVFKCKMCGGDLNVTEQSSIAICEYCGTKQTLSKSNDEIVTNLFNRANNLRLKCEFDKAQEIYEKIVTRTPEDSEAYWGIVLCKYGIEYVEDPMTFNRIPTCHRTLVESVLSDVDYISCIENADESQKLLYINEAKEIDELQKDILSIASKEKPYDIFICYKESDNNGKRTKDSVIANDIYYQLVQEGFKVFYAAITLEDKLGQEYEPYIYSALNSAKVMLVVGTKPEYFNAVWVKNEWSRYLKIIKNDRNKLLIPCYRDMDAYDLPEEFSHLQALDMGKIGFINDVVRGINKLFRDADDRNKLNITSKFNDDIHPFLKRAFMFLEDGEFERADEFFEQVLNRDPECSDAYIGKLLIDLKLKSKKELVKYDGEIKNNLNYSRIMRFGSEEHKKLMQQVEKNHLAKIETNKHQEIEYKKKIDKVNCELINNYRNNSIDLSSSDLRFNCPNCNREIVCSKQTLLDDFYNCPECNFKITISRELKNIIEDDIIQHGTYEIRDSDYVDVECPWCNENISFTKWEIKAGNLKCPWCENEIEIDLDD